MNSIDARIVAVSKMIIRVLPGIEIILLNVDIDGVDRSSQKTKEWLERIIKKAKISRHRCNATSICEDVSRSLGMGGRKFCSRCYYFPQGIDKEGLKALNKILSECGGRENAARKSNLISLVSSSDKRPTLLNYGEEPREDLPVEVQGKVSDLVQKLAGKNKSDLLTDEDGENPESEIEEVTEQTLSSEPDEIIVDPEEKPENTILETTGLDGQVAKDKSESSESKDADTEAIEAKDTPSEDESRAATPETDELDDQDTGSTDGNVNKKGGDQEVKDNKSKLKSWSRTPQLELRFPTLPERDPEPLGQISQRKAMEEALSRANKLNVPVEIWKFVKKTGINTSLKTIEPGQEIVKPKKKEGLQSDKKKTDRQINLVPARPGTDQMKKRIDNMFKNMLPDIYDILMGESGWYNADSIIKDNGMVYLCREQVGPMAVPRGILTIQDIKRLVIEASEKPIPGEIFVRPLTVPEVCKISNKLYTDVLRSRRSLA